MVQGRDVVARGAEAIAPVAHDFGLVVHAFDRAVVDAHLEVASEIVWPSLCVCSPRTLESSP